ncbi:MAG: thioredoxin family protein [Candidatus Micrarchaeota archaeon]|nr:thioredoxin family protein [Candidatus Micrarchaeota archaeon]
MKKILSSDKIGHYMKLIASLLVLLAAGILLSGCLKQVSCNPPYVQIGTKCCLDSNNNSICDEDETSPINNTPQNNTPANFTNKTGESENISSPSLVIESDFVEFFGGGCIYCQRMAPIVSQVENETGVNFTKLETWSNETNYELYKQYEPVIVHDCGFSGVPAFINIRTARAICGEMSASDLKQFVKENSNPSNE